MANTVNFSGLTEYIDQNREQLFVKSVTGSKTLDYVDIYPDVVFKQALHYLDSKVVLGDGKSCTFDPEGDDTFSERYIEVKPLKINKEFCAKSLRTKYLNYQYQWEAGRIELPAHEALANANVAAAQEAVEDLLWQGLENPEIKGFIAIAEEDVPEANKVTFASGATATAKIDAVVAKLPIKALKKGVDVFVSYTDFRNYVQEQNAACCSKKEVLDAASDSIAYFGDSRVRIVPVLGLEGQGAILAAPRMGLVYGTDIVGSEGVYKWVVDDKTDNWYLRIDFTAGMQIKEPDLVVLGE